VQRARTPPRARVAGLLAVLLACQRPEPGETETGARTTGPASDGGSSTASATTDAPSPPTACVEPTTVTGAPRTIGEAVAFINALPRPLTLDCVLERLERPLALAATRSVVSLQPAAGERSPRLFLFAGDLFMSVAVDGHGVDLLEFGELVGAGRSIKAEIKFPVEGELALEAPFSRIYDGVGGTNCAICHRGESAAPEYPLAFASDALRFPDAEAVPLADLRREYERCDPLAEPARCARLTAVFGHGPVEPGAFAADLLTIYDYE
jgi:hypothetical protein